MPRMWGRFLSLVVLGWGLVLPPAGAQEPTPPDSEAAADAQDSGSEAGSALPTPPAVAPRTPLLRLAILVLATGDLDPDVADALTELVIGAVAGRGGVTIVGKEEFQARLGQGEASSIECVSSTACLGRVGVELGVDELMAGTVARRGGRWVFNINRIDIHTGQLAGRAFREVDGDVGALADAIQDAVPSLYEQAERAATLLVSANVEPAEVSVDGMVVGTYRGEPLRVPDVTAGRHELLVSAAGRHSWRRSVNVSEGATVQLEAVLDIPVVSGGVSPLVWVGAVVAGVGAGGAIGFGLSSRRDPAADESRADQIDFVDARRRDALIANIGMGVAAAGVAMALLGLLLSDFGGAEEDVAGLTIEPRAGGTMLSVAGSF